MSDHGFDLSTIDPTAACDVASTLVVKDPRTGLPIRVGGTEDAPEHVTINLLGFESTKGRAKRRELQRARLSRVARGKKLDVTPERLDEEKLALLVVLTTGWQGVVWKGERLDCTASNARMLYSAPSMGWLLDQIEEHVGDLDQYMGNSDAVSDDSPGTTST